MRFDHTGCSHCGRENCLKLGDSECDAARKQMFEDMQKRIEHYAELQRKKRTFAASMPSKEGK